MMAAVQRSHACWTCRSGDLPPCYALSLVQRPLNNVGVLVVSRRLTARSLAIAKANAQAGIDAALTIAARTQGLLAPGGGGAAKAREAQLMVQEKLDAAVEGVLGAQAAWGAFVVKAAFGGVRTPHDVSAGLTAVAQAAAGPARRKVRANARRLTGAKALP
jgi:hypothetical protein